MPHLIKRGALYFTGSTFVPSQREAKRYHIEPTSAFCAYVAMLLSDAEGPAYVVELVPATPPPPYVECDFGHFDPMEWID